MDDRLRWEITRLIVLILFFFFISISMALAQFHSDRMYDQEVTGAIKGNLYAREPLHDILISYLPDWTARRSWLPDAFMLPLMALSFLSSVLLPLNRRLKYQGIIVLRRFVFLASVLFLFRMLTVFLTTVPSPVGQCQPVYVRTGGGPEEYFVLLVRMISGQISTCTDNIYSGHTTLIVLSVLLTIHYSGRPLLAIYAFFHGLLALLTIIITRLHYTVDVILAVLLSSFTYLGYHGMLMIFVDVRLLKDVPVIDRNPESYEERRLLLRMISFPVLKALAWVDGLDMRLD